MRPENWHERKNKEQKEVVRILTAVQKKYDAHVVLFRYGSQWAVIGDDADRLFELFAWQTASVTVSNNEQVSWMQITRNGMEVLKDSPYSIKVLAPGPISLTIDSALEDMIACTQQFADYKRMMIRKMGSVQKSLKTCLSAFAGSPDIKQKIIIRSFEFDDDRIFANLQNVKRILLADGRNWLLDDIGLSLNMALGTAAGQKTA